MALEKYRQKRNFRVTPEPAGKLKRRKTQELVFVVQKHAARRLHYDFRLELNGVLLSWAVPKGPSFDPNDKRLAMHVEDHPLEYGDFEGVIPPKQYGAGTVMVWDRGTWTPKTDPAEAYAKGRMKFELDGEKLHGGWNLVKSHGGKYGGENSWLLFKEADEFARLGPDALVTEDKPDSVLSGRNMDEIAAEADRVWHSNKSVAANVKSGAVAKPKATIKLDAVKGARKAPFPREFDVQLATLVKSPPSGASWVHEIKYDGYRMLCLIEHHQARLVSRNAKDWTANFPSLARILSRLPVDNACLDGEVVVVDAKGRTSFQALQNAIAPTEGSAQPLTYFAFDLLYLNGFDLRALKLAERKEILHKLLSSAPPAVKYSDHFAALGADFLKNVCQLGLEGMVSKRSDLSYQAGRGTAWQKVKCLQRQEMVIGGYTDPEGSRHGFGALLLGVYEPDGRLAYAGKVGTGFNEASLTSLSGRLAGLTQKQSPFYNPPTGAEGRRARWVKPTLVAEVEFTEWTDDGTLRHPSFQGLRSDKPATEVVRERPVNPSHASVPDPAPPPAAARSKGPTRANPNELEGIALTNPDKALYPEAKITKRDLANYYAAVGEHMLQHVADRPLTLFRCPNGWDKGCFYQKKAETSVNEAIARVEIRSSEGTADYMMANTASALIALVQMGVLEVHPWGSRAQHLGRPDRIIFDLDPADDVAWEQVKQAALIVKELLENIGLTAFLKTTGGKGLHVVVAIEPSVDWEQVKGFTKAVAEFLERTFPDRFTSNLLKVSRHGKIFIDYLRNSEGATAVGAYSTRARSNAPVSAPVAWDELGNDVRFAHFNVGNMPKRIARMKKEPWHGLEASAAALTKAIMARVGFKGR